MFRDRTFRTLVGLAAALAITACGDDDGTGPEDDGESDVFVTGDIVESFEGTAVFAESNGMWILSLNGEDASDGEVTMLLEGSRPAVDTYVFDQAGTVGAVFVPGGSNDGLLASDGTLTIQESTQDRVSGTFYFDATEGDVTITVTGSFDAVNTQ